MSGTQSGIGYDVATALWQGARPYQEDTLLADFHGGMDRGFAILADGMGGHAAGDLASRLVVIDAASHLKFLMHDGEALEKSLVSELSSAIEAANDMLKERAAEDPRLSGMGTTFLATVVFEDRLYWASVGDSPLYLWREGELRQLNEDHSMAPVIDQMAKAGEITAEAAAKHPDRNALTSVLMGSPLKAVDVPKTATVLDHGDVLIQASDGLQYLDEKQISRVLAGGGSSREIADALMAALRDLEDEGQDNTAIVVLQLTQTRALAPRPASRSDSNERAMDATAGRAVGLTPPVDTAPARVPPPTSVARPAGARRWLVPAGIVGAAAVAAGLVFGLPALQSEPEAPVSLDTAAAVPAPIAPLQPAPLAPAPATEGASASDVHEIIGGNAVAAGGATATAGATGAANPIPDKLANASLAVPAAASGATIPFGTDADGAEQAPETITPGPSAVGLDGLVPSPDAVPQREGSSAPETEGAAPAAPASDGGVSDGG